MMGHATGTMLGHAIPGTWFLLWGLWWLIYIARRRGAESGWKPGFTVSPVEPYLRIAAGVAGALGELYWGNWVLVDSSIINFQHATMFLAFSLSGVAEILALQRRLPAYGGQVAFIAALLIEALLFSGHSNAAGLPQTVHRLLVWIIVATAMWLALELRRQSIAFSLGKSFALIVQGTWFWQIGYMLYVSEMDPMSHASIMMSYLYLAWHLLVISCLMFLAYKAIPPATGSRTGVAM